MNANVNETKNQQVPPTRRRFLRKISAAAGAAVATMTLPAATASSNAPAGPLKGANGFVISASYDELKMLAEYNGHMLAHMCLMSELMREWYKANEDNIRMIWPEAESDLYDFMFETHASARVVACAAGIELDQAYIAKRAAEYRSEAEGGAA